VAGLCVYSVAGFGRGPACLAWLAGVVVSGRGGFAVRRGWCWVVEKDETARVGCAVRSLGCAALPFFFNGPPMGHFAKRLREQWKLRRCSIPPIHPTTRQGDWERRARRLLPES